MDLSLFQVANFPIETNLITLRLAVLGRDVI